MIAVKGPSGYQFALLTDDIHSARLGEGAMTKKSVDVVEYFTEGDDNNIFEVVHGVFVA